MKQTINYKKWRRMAGGALLCVFAATACTSQSRNNYVCNNGNAGSGTSAQPGTQRCVSCNRGFWLRNQNCVATSLTTKLNAQDKAEGDEFGRSVMLDGNYALIGAYLNDDAGSASGSAYIFKHSGTSWTQQAKLTASDGVSGDYFGWSVALDGNYALIGADSDDDNGTDSGSAYIFIRNGSSWTQQTKLKPNDGATGDYFGWSVALDGNYALIGAYRDDVDGSADAGSVYIFIRNGSSWTQQAKLTASDSAFNDRFGNLGAVAISGDYALIGAYLDDDAGSESGSAYIFKRSGTSWTQQAKLRASDEATGDRFGHAAAISGDYALIGANLDDDNGSASGSAYIFKRSGTSWTQQAKLTASDGATNDQFGAALTLVGDYALIGAHQNTNDGVNSGAVYIFKRNGNDWSQQAKITASDKAANDQFGTSMTLSGNNVLIGAYQDDDGGSDSGSVYVLDF